MAENGTASSKFVLDIIKFVLPTLLAVAFGYGSAKFTAGAIEQRITNMEHAVMEMKAQHERYITREELKAYLDGQTRALDRIADDVRELRKTR